MNVTKIHAARYEIHNGEGHLIGIVTKSSEGWHYQTGKGAPLKTSRLSPAAICNLVSMLGVLAHPVTSWAALFRAADDHFGRNFLIAQAARR